MTNGSERVKKQWWLLFSKADKYQEYLAVATWTGSVEIKLVANLKWSTIESEYLLSGSPGTLRNRVTGTRCICFSPKLRQDPLEAILVIFGGRALIFLCESSWKIMKNDTTFVRMRSGDHLGDAKMPKKGTLLRPIYLFINCDRQKQFSLNARRRADQQNVASDFFLFCPGT